MATVQHSKWREDDELTHIQDEVKSMTENEFREALGLRPLHLDEDEDALCAYLYGEREDESDYRQFLNDTVDDAHYNAYLDWIHTPKADEY